MEAVLAKEMNAQTFCEKIKEEGNAFFRSIQSASDLLGQNYKDALSKYNYCLTIDSSSGKAAIYFANRALVHIKLENNQLAINDTCAAMKINPNYAKAYYRRATAYCALNNWRKAIEDFSQAWKLAPTDLEAKEKYEWAVKESQYKKYASALDIGSILDRCKEEEIIVERAYRGPSLDHVKNINHKWIISLMKYLKEEKRLHKRYVVMMIKALAKIYKKRPNIVEITIEDNSSITVCGDLHGQFYDLVTILKTNGFPSLTNPYLFNGDFVDRGSFSIEVMLTLISWNLLYPNSFFLNRGNHEAIQLNTLYGYI